MTLGKFLVLLIVGGLAGSLAGRVATFTKEGFGRWINLAVGMVGALVGNLLFWMLHIDFGLGEFQITLEDLIAAFTGSLLCIGGWWGWRWYKGKSAVTANRSA